jgi:hypothetical protein
LDKFILRPAQPADFPAIRRLIFEMRLNPFGLDWRRFIVADSAGAGFAACA